VLAVAVDTKLDMRNLPTEISNTVEFENLNLNYRAQRFMIEFN